MWAEYLLLLEGDWPLLMLLARENILQKKTWEFKSQRDMER